jgi:GR25 family glycosyltransferase involved in LPS biosynthesis
MLDYYKGCMTNFDHAYVISIRTERLRLFIQKCPDTILSMLEIVHGTDGRKIDLVDWRQRGLLDKPSCSRLMANPHVRECRRGELGCYDSHRRTWQKVAQSNHGALIFEDDADLSPFHVGQMLHWLQHRWDRQVHGEVDILYLNHNWHAYERTKDSTMGVPHIEDDYQQLTSYVLWPSGARKLLADSVPYCAPVDVYVASQTRGRHLRALQWLGEEIGVCLSEISDTQKIV